MLLAVLKFDVRDCTGPSRECISGGARLPAENGRYQRESGQIPGDGPYDGSRDDDGEHRHAGHPFPAGALHDHEDEQQGQADEQEALSTNAAARSPWRRSCVMRSPPQAGQFQPVRALKGQAGNRKRGLCGSPMPM